jgi:hypothetical protein
MNAHVEHPYVAKLNRVLARMGGIYTAADILEKVGLGTMQMFAEGDSIAITQISVYPQKRVLDIIAVVGSIKDLRILHDRILTFAAEVGVDVIQAYGRGGWMADALKRGWTVKARSFVYHRGLK